MKIWCFYSVKKRFINSEEGKWWKNSIFASIVDAATAFCLSDGISNRKKINKKGYPKPE